MPSLCHNIYNSFRESDDQFLRTNEFFLKVLDLIIFYIPIDVPELLETLNRILDDNRPFYMHQYDKEVGLLSSLSYHF